MIVGIRISNDYYDNILNTGVTVLRMLRYVNIILYNMYILNVFKYMILIR